MIFDNENVIIIFLNVIKFLYVGWSVEIVFLKVFGWKVNFFGKYNCCVIYLKFFWYFLKLLKLIMENFFIEIFIINFLISFFWIYCNIIVFIVIFKMFVVVIVFCIILCVICI